MLWSTARHKRKHRQPCHAPVVMYRCDDQLRINEIHEYVLVRLLVSIIAAVEGPTVPVHRDHDTCAAMALPGACVFFLQWPLHREQNSGRESLLAEEGAPSGSINTMHQAVVL